MNTTKKNDNPDPRIQALIDALEPLLQQRDKKNLLGLTEVLISVILKHQQEQRGERYILNDDADDMKVIATIPMSRYSRLLTQAFDEVLGELAIEPEIEQSLERLLAPYERPDGEHHEAYFDVYLGLADEIKPCLKAALLPLVSQQGFGELLQHIAHARMREVDHIRAHVKKRRREKLGIHEVKKPEDDADV